MEIEDLFTKMKEFKIEHPTLENHEILRMFNILALQNLTTQIERLALK